MQTNQTTTVETSTDPGFRTLRSRNSNMVLSQDKYECIYILAKKGLSAEDVCNLTIDNILIDCDTTTISIPSIGEDGCTPCVKNAELDFKEAMLLAKYINNNSQKIKENRIIFFAKNPKLGDGKTKPHNMTTGLRDYIGKKYKLGLQDIGWMSKSAAKAKTQTITDMEGLRNLLESFK